MNRNTVLRATRCLRLRTVLGVLSACALTTCASGAQSGPYIDGGNSKAVNPTAVPVKMLVMHFKADNITDGYKILKVEAHGSTLLGLPADSKVVDMVFLNPSIPKTRMPICAPPAARFTRLSRSVAREQLAMTERAVQQNLDQTELAASAKAAVGTQQAVDEMSTKLSDPAMAAKYNLMRDSATTQAEVSAANTQQAAEMTVDALAGGLNAAMANAAIITAHSEQSAKEAQSIQHVIDINRTALNDLQLRYNNMKTIYAAQREFDAQAAGDLSAAGATISVASAPVEFVRACPGAADYRDVLSMKFASAAPGTTLLAKVRFDHGGEGDVIFYRVQATDQWVGILYWPVEASRASVQVGTGKGTRKLGEFRAERDSMEKQFDEARKSLAPLKKAHRQAEYAGQGGDENRTVIVP